VTSLGIGLSAGLVLVVALVAFLVVKYRKHTSEDSRLVAQLTEHVGREKVSPELPAEDMDVELAKLYGDRFSVRLGTLSGLDTTEDDVWV
jgi:hypothetical protein